MVLGLLGLLVPLGLLVGGCASEGPAREPVLGQVEQQMAVCAEGPTVYGIDVSRFQGDISWQPVADSGVVYAYIQISRSLTDLDAKFAYNWRRAKEVGILRGAYQRFQPDQDVIGQAEVFLSTLGPFEPGDLPPMLDVEDSGGLGPAVIAQKVRQWIDHVEPRVGVRPIIYTGFYFWRDQVGGADFAEHPLWIANYGTDCPLVPPTWTRWAFHQYSSTAVIPGITANTVDVNLFNGTLADLVALGAPPVCGDGACRVGGETADTCPADCAPCQLIEDAPAILDDAGACFAVGGPPASIRTEAAGHAGSLRWTYVTAAATADNHATWNLHFASAGRYRVEAHTPAPFNQSRQAVYRVTHGATDPATETAVELDQAAVDGWQSLGEYTFDAGGHGQAIHVADNTGEPLSARIQIVFDAVRVTRLDPPDPDPTDPDPTDPTGEPGSDGCAIAGTGGGGALLGLGTGLALVLVRRRRPMSARR